MALSAFSFGQTPVDLPVDFENANVAYDLVDFGGNGSMIMTDPTNANNKIAHTTKSNTADLWAGTTIGGTVGFGNPIPFNPNATTMSMKVYSPDAGIPVRMKVEDPNDPAKSVETEAYTTQVNTWETLDFNFLNQASGTAALNYGTTYKKLSVFFNFGTTGAVAGAKDYYWDDVMFTGQAGTGVNITFQVANASASPVYLFGSWSNWSNWPGDLMTSVGGGVYEKTLQLSASSSYEYLFVNGDTVKEALNPAWSCTNNNGQYTNRTLMTGTADEIICRKWATCDSCNAVVPSNINVTFMVESPDSTPVYVFGSWSNWLNWPGTQMTPIGNNQYTATISMTANAAIEYLFVNGVGTKEILDPSWTCTNGNTQFTNRMAQLGVNDVSYCYIWQTCNTCAVAIDPTLKDKMELSLSKDGVRINSDIFSEVEGLEIVDVLGRTIFSADKMLHTNRLIPVVLQTNSLYFVNVKINNQVVSYKSMMAY
jgi:hypothetical protein